MQHDLFGHDTSLTSPQALKDWNAAQLGFLAHAAVTPEHLGRVLDADPGFVMGQAVKGLFMLLLGRREMVPVALTARDAAAAAARDNPPTWRELRYLAALEAWLAGSATRAIAEMQQVLDRHPADPLAMKLDHAIRFVLGDAAGMLAAIERVLPAYAPDHAARGYLLGCHAFALEEAGAYEKAEIAGRQALWMASDDAWGLHAVAHVHDMTCNAQAGLEWLSGHESAWTHCNNFRYHVWWHKALLHLDQGEIDVVLDLYDHEIRRDKTDDYRDISNATSLLMRLELEGVGVGNRWDELAELSAARTEDGSLIFADLHYLLALEHGDRRSAAETMIRRIARDGAAGGGDANARMAAPGCDAATGLHHFGEGQYDKAFACLKQARGSMQLAGGSHAQRDVFERMTIDAGLRAGQLDAAEAILDDRRARRAGRDDAYAAARRSLIAAGRDMTDISRVPAQ